MSTEQIILQTLRSGQPRPCADSVCEALISARVDGMLLRGLHFWRDLPKERIKDLARLLVHKFSSVVPSWPDAHLQTCEPIGLAPAEIAEWEAQPGHTSASLRRWRPKLGCRWRVVIVQPYVD